MYKRKLKILAFVVVILAAGVLGALIMRELNRPSEFGLFIKDFSGFTDELVLLIENDPSVEGVERAQKFLNERKAAIQERISRLKTLKGPEVGEETQKRFEKAMIDNGNKMNNLLIDLGPKIKDETEFGNKVKTLFGDYVAFFR
jgi:hypothetical protein